MFTLRFGGRIAATVLLASTTLSMTLEAQDERLSVHGSATIAYGKADNLPVTGITKDGTSDYRLLALQFGYKISDKDRVVTQLLHRKIGSSPLNAIVPAIEPVWAFYEHRFDNGVSLKAGRNPLPRGIFNEIRYIGTLLPLFRVGNAVYGETLEFVDGVVVRKPFDLGNDWKIDATVFGGGYDLRAQIPSASGVSVVNTRNENTIGGQVWLNTPIDGVRVGAFANNYMSTPSSTLPEAQRPNRTTTLLYSAEAVFSKAFARGEYTTFKQTKSPNFVDFASYYVQAGITPTEQLTLTAEYNDGRNVVRFAGTQIPNIDLPLNQDIALGVAFKPSAQIAFKLEGHRVEGYQFDRAVPSVIPPTAPPLVARLAPASKTFYGLVSVAFSF
ncbi:MAG: hypothetical protein IBJ03_07225 [Gemmatimonadaceae bacterium]|nr:hypothetical protein [Gemmatimonadaceae bacterium]